MDIEWKSRYEIGNTEIDSEHEVFLKTIRKIKQAVLEKKDKEFIEYLLKELLLYADFHFCSEENIMRSIDFPNINGHQKLHQSLLIELRNKIHYIHGKKEHDVNELISFLVHWFINHTLHEDRQIAAFINKKT